jgi:hypothetical protein
MYEENYACRMVADSMAPTRYMLHIAIHDFALQDWIEQNIFALKVCAYNANASDMFTKQVGKIFVHVTMITFPAGRLSLGSIYDLILVPRHSSGAKGGGSVPCR